MNRNSGPASAGMAARHHRNTHGAGNTRFYAGGTVVASLDGVHSKVNQGAGVYAVTGSRVTVSNSVLSGNVDGAYANAQGGTVRLVIERSVVTGNSYGILATTTVSGDVAEVTASHNTVTHNTQAGVFASQAPSATATVVADGNTVTENGSGFLFGGGTPTIFTRGNNTVKFNTPDFLGGATLTALAGQ